MGVGYDIGRVAVEGALPLTADFFFIFRSRNAYFGAFSEFRPFEY